MKPVNIDIDTGRSVNSKLATFLCWLMAVACVLAVVPPQASAEDAGPGKFVPRANRRPRRAITDAPFLAAREVTDQVSDNELVLGVVVGGQSRAYPINQLTGPSREIVNDTLGGRAIAATW